MSGSNQGPPSWLFSNNPSNPAFEPSLSTTNTPKMGGGKKTDKIKAKAKPSKKEKGASKKASLPPGELMDLVETFLSEHSFTGAHSAFKKQREKEGLSASDSATKDATLVGIFQTWEASSKAKKAPTSKDDDSSSSSESSDSDSDDEEDVDMKDAEDAKSSSGSSSSDSESEDEKKAAPAPKNLKRKAPVDDSSSSESSSDSDSDSDSSDDSSSDDEPKAKKQKRAKSESSSSSSSGSESSSESDDSHDKDSSDSDSSSSDSDSDSGSDSDSDSDSGSDSDSDSEGESEVEKAAKVPLPDSDGSSSSSSDSDSDSDSDSSKPSKTKGANDSDSSVTLDKTSPELTSTTSSVSNPPLPPDPVLNGKGRKQQNEAFSRIPKDIKVDARFASNEYISMSYSQRAFEDLIVTKGKGFTKEKNKKKRGGFRGGAIDIQERKSIYFDD